MHSPLHTAGSRREWVWLWREMRPFLSWQAANLSCIVAATTAGLSQPLLMRWLIDEALPKHDWHHLVAATTLLLFTSVARLVLTSLGSLVNTIAVKRMTFRMRMRLVTHVMSLSAGFHSRRSVGDLLERLQRDVMLVGELGADVLPTMVRVIVEASMALALMVYLDWRLSAIVLPLVGLFAYVRHYYRGILRNSAEAARASSGRQSSLLQEMLAGAVQIQLLGAEQRVRRRHKRLALQTVQREIRQTRDELMFTVVSMTVISLGVAAAIGYGGARVIDGALTLGSLVAFYGYVATIFSPIGIAVGLYAALTRVEASVRRLIEIEQKQDFIRDALDAQPIAAAPRQLAYDNVSFRYGTTSTLTGVRFTLRAGERVAIVGASGSGKSSLVQLLPRLYDVNAGCVELDGRDVRSLRLSSLRQAISFVPQDPMLFEGTLRDNVRYGCPTASREELEQAAWIACLTDVIQQLPNGWDTELGPMGAGLSGGERQRLAITRALLQKRPVLILDEATSALDAATEHRLLSRLDTWIDGRIVILVTHRLAAAKWADRVVVMSHGEVVEDGCHRRLSSTDTHYAALWHAGAS